MDHIFLTLCGAPRAACLPVCQHLAQPVTRGHWAHSHPKENRAVLGRAGQTVSKPRGDTDLCWDSKVKKAWLNIMTFFFLSPSVVFCFLLHLLSP